MHSESQPLEVSQPPSNGGEGEEETDLLATQTGSKSTQSTTVQPHMVYHTDTAGSQDTVVVVMNSETSSVSCLKTENRSC